jgi:mRNA guanylyltransferase
VDDHGNEIHYLIDRKNDYYYIPGIHLPHQSDPTFEKFHKDTLLDGELVRDHLRSGQEKLRYYVFDCLALDGEVLSTKTFDKRIGRFAEYIQKPLHKFIERYRQDYEQFPFEILMKKLEKPYALDDLFVNIIPKLPHGNDGLVFTAKDDLYRPGTDDMILKWKSPDENTLDFKIMIGDFPVVDYGDGGPPVEDWDAKPEIFLLVYFGEKSGRYDYRKFTTLHVTDAEWEAIKGLNEQIDGRLIECFLDEDVGGKWRPKLEADGTPRFRDDKEFGNHISTVPKVLNSIVSGPTEEELRAEASKIMHAWKRRHPEEDRRRQNGH